MTPKEEHSFLMFMQNNSPLKGTVYFKAKLTICTPLLFSRTESQWFQWTVQRILPGETSSSESSAQSTSSGSDRKRRGSAGWKRCGWRGLSGPSRTYTSLIAALFNCCKVSWSLHIRGSIGLFKFLAEWITFFPWNTVASLSISSLCCSSQYLSI